ncbi:MAG TPA: hypothetical protein VGI06_00805 [Acidimicrobiales bacterium]
MDRSPPSSDAALVVAVAVGAAAVGLWAGGSILIRLWTGRGAGVPLTGALGLLVRTGAAPARPGAAWPAHTRLPPVGALLVGEGSAAAAALALVSSPFWYASGRWPGPPAGRVRRPSAGRLARRRRPFLAVAPRRSERAGWARRRDLAPLRVPAPGAGRLTLGRCGRQLLAAEPRASVVVLGP